MSKYIIKNCPAIYKKLRINKNNEVYIDEYRCNYQTLNPCRDCTDCVMKQIVELCKEQTQFCEDCPTSTCENCEFSTSGFAEEVIELFDIQEVE